jgi:hypothetical protein
MLDQNGDYSFGKGQQNFTYGTYAVSQAIKTRLALLKNEWWEDLDSGLPLFQNILGQPGTSKNLLLVDSLIKKTIAETQDVINIKSFESSYENRKYSFSCTVETKYGDATVSKSF